MRAEFLPVLASAYSRPFRLAVEDAATVQLTANSLTLTGNAQTTYTGNIKRTTGFSATVEVSLVNLPAGYASPRVTISPDQENFEVVVSAPAVAADIDIPNIQFRVTTLSGSLLKRDTPVPTKVVPGQ